MEKVISKIVKHIMEKKFPKFIDVDVKKEKDFFNTYVNDELNYEYHIFLTVDYSDFIPISNSGEWDKLKSFIREIIRISGIKNPIRIYINFPDED